ncbi:hypothetical protein J2Z69_000749 [Paenibacillus shirakamiensis]|uniref:Uncharacterized protein n=1 Tax=Paenibacillus shirakamiensis TaxID=1265935 RepID=A0ABS4JDC6_9BACL|nr:hypothetical protein [Paenibacillus shirakamiensis]MBP1999730.1 hypothetical protein [Paenibacillus shirakamiensis]
MEQIEDFELYEKDFDKWLEIGRAAFAADAQEVMDDTSKDWPDRIRAAAEFKYKQMEDGQNA